MNRLTPLESEPKPLNASERTETARPAAPTSRKTTRLGALDFTKGALVLTMVLYHWLNYFVSPDGSFYKYLRFLTPSFIFITGFLISQAYLRKYHPKDPWLARRLLHRGLKLLGIFVFLNLAIGMLVPVFSGALFRVTPTDVIASFFIKGNTGRSAAFSILVPISCLLLLSAGLAIITRYYRHAFHAACLACMMGVLIVSLSGGNNASLDLISIGLLGVSLGSIPIDKFHSVLGHTPALLLTYLAYLGAITMWNEVYPLQVTGVCLTLAVIYVVGTRIDGTGRIGRTIMLLGQYSLFGYISQIAILQLLHRGFQHVSFGSATTAMALIAGFAFTLLSVEATDRARANASLVNKVYIAIFS
jgi:peptidoglycan/LPS O-acetylase OafA/YrhL